MPHSFDHFETFETGLVVILSNFVGMITSLKKSQTLRTDIRFPSVIIVTEERALVHYDLLAIEAPRRKQRGMRSLLQFKTHCRDVR
jgi:hypothetical protein